MHCESTYTCQVVASGHLECFTIDIIDISFLDSAETRSFSFSTRMMLLQFPESSKHDLVNLYLVFSVVDTTVVTPNPSSLVHDKFSQLAVFSFDVSSSSALIPKTSVELSQAMPPAFVTSFHLTR